MTSDVAGRTQGVERDGSGIRCDDQFILWRDLSFENGTDIGRPIWGVNAGRTS